MRFLRTVHMRGTMTLPNDIRAALGISEGDIVEFEVHRVVRKASPSPSSSPSLSPSRSPSPSLRPITISVPTNGEA